MRSWIMGMLAFVVSAVVALGGIVPASAHGRGPAGRPCPPPPVPIPGSQGPGLHDWLRIDAGCGSDVWAGGHYSVLGGPATAHWDGKSWTMIHGVDPGWETEFQAMAIVRHDDVWAVGDSTGGTGGGYDAQHWDGKTWSESPLPAFPAYGQFTALTGVHAISSRDVWASGYWTSHGQSDVNADPPKPILLHWDGSRWSIVFIWPAGEPPPPTPYAV